MREFIPLIAAAANHDLVPCVHGRAVLIDRATAARRALADRNS